MVKSKRKSSEKLTTSKDRKSRQRERVKEDVSSSRRSRQEPQRPTRSPEHKTRSRTRYERPRSVRESRPRRRARSVERRTRSQTRHERSYRSQIEYSRSSRNRRSRSRRRSRVERSRTRSDQNPFFRRQPQETKAQEFQFPTDPHTAFAQAMSSIACNAESQAKGVFSRIANGQDNFREELSQALALKLNFKTTQQANEKALLNLLKSKGKATDLKQMLQARSALYGEMLDPS